MKNFKMGIKGPPLVRLVLMVSDTTHAVWRKIERRKTIPERSLVYIYKLYFSKTVLFSIDDPVYQKREACILFLIWGRFAVLFIRVV